MGTEIYLQCLMNKLEDTFSDLTGNLKLYQSNRCCWAPNGGPSVADPLRLLVWYC